MHTFRVVHFCFDRVTIATTTRLMTYNHSTREYLCLSSVHYPS